MNVRVSYFAALAEATGTRDESLSTDATTTEELYREVAKRHAFTWPAQRITTAVNDHIVTQAVPIHEGDHIMFLPPVSGG